MSILTLNMSDYEIVNDAPSSDLYDEEILSTGWTPELGLQPYVTTPNTTLMTSDLASLDVETFLKKMYAYQN